MSRAIIKRVRQSFVPVCLTLLLFIILKFVILIGYVPSASMEPNIHEGSFIVGTRLYDRLNRGDVVIFRKDGVLQVKRIMALSGDLICWDNLPYIQDYPRPERPAEPTRVPDGYIFLLGDNIGNSLDSRYWAEPFVPVGDVEAVLVY